MKYNLQIIITTYFNTVPYYLDDLCEMYPEIMHKICHGIKSTYLLALAGPRPINLNAALCIQFK